MELDDNPAARDGSFADAPDMNGRDTMLKERTEQQTRTDKETDTGHDEENDV